MVPKSSQAQKQEDCFPCLENPLMLTPLFRFKLIINTCMVSFSVNSYLDSIVSTPKSFINDYHPDSCVLSLLDTLSQKAIQTREVRYLQALEAVCIIKDGYVSEYLLEIGTFQFYQNFESVLHYMFSNHESGNNPIRELIIEAISMQISDGGAKAEDELKEYVSSKANTAKLYKGEVDFLMQLQKDFNPYMFR